MWNVKTPIGEKPRRHRGKRQEVAPAVLLPDRCEAGGEVSKAPGYHHRDGFHPASAGEDTGNDESLCGSDPGSKGGVSPDSICGDHPRGACDDSPLHRWQRPGRTVADEPCLTSSWVSFWRSSPRSFGWTTWTPWIRHTRAMPGRSSVSSSGCVTRRQKNI